MAIMSGQKRSFIVLNEMAEDEREPAVGLAELAVRQQKSDNEETDHFFSFKFLKEKKKMLTEGEKI